MHPHVSLRSDVQLLLTMPPVFGCRLFVQLLDALYLLDTVKDAKGLVLDHTSFLSEHGSSSSNIVSSRVEDTKLKVGHGQGKWSSCAAVCWQLLT